MKRRVLLGALPLVLSGCLSTLPGPTGPRNPPTEPEDDPREKPQQKPLVTGDFQFEETDSGTLRVVLTVANRTDVDRTGTVVGTLTLKGETYEGKTTVTVGGGSEIDAELVYESVDYATFENAKSFDFNAQVR